jgi:hypothetical protein
MSLTTDTKNIPLTFETPNGKVIEVYMPERSGNGYRIRFKSGGQLPKKLQGIFLSKNSATQAVQVYLDSPEVQVKQEKKDAKAKKEASKK